MSEEDSRSTAGDAATIPTPNRDAGTPTHTAYVLGGSGSRRSKKRVDIQMVRALAVTLVLLYHLELPGFSAGFIGVDIFFVVSGYLVFGSLMREISGGKFAALDFVTRRMKRLSLPSAATLTFVSSVLLLGGAGVCKRSAHCSAPEQFRDLRSASLHYANLQFLSSARAYFAKEGGPSLALHYWSLSVEEQLYLFVPLLLLPLLFLRCSAFAGEHRARVFSALAQAYLLATSLASLSLVFRQEQATKFFFPAARYWEFALGAALAHSDSDASLSLSPRLQRSLFVLIVVVLAMMGSVISLENWPTWVAVPVCLLSVALIWLRPQFPNTHAVLALEALGNVSYSVYLVHWPVIHLLRYCNPQLSSAGQVAAALFLTAVFTALSYNLIELPVQSVRWPRRLTLAVFVSATVLPALISQVGYQQAQLAVDRERMAATLEAERLAHKNDLLMCNNNNNNQQGVIGGWVDASRMPWRLDGNNYTRSELLKNAGALSVQYIVENPEYNNPWRLTRRSDKVLVALVGDSHACQYSAAARDAAEALGASFVQATWSNPGATQYIAFTTQQPLPGWWDQFPIRVVVVAGYCFTDGSTPVDQIASTMLYWARQATCLVHMAEGPKYFPRTGQTLTAGPCILQHIDTLKQSCARTLEAAGVGFDVSVFNRTARDNAEFADRAEVLDNSDLVCWDGRCPAHIGNIPVTADYDHYNQMAAVLLHSAWRQRLLSTRCASRTAKILAGN